MLNFSPVCRSWSMTNEYFKQKTTNFYFIVFMLLTNKFLFDIFLLESCLRKQLHLLQEGSLHVESNPPPGRLQMVGLLLNVELLSSYLTMQTVTAESLNSLFCFSFRFLRVRRAFTSQEVWQLWARAGPPQVTWTN